MDKIAVLIPCYNESQTIEQVITDWRTALPDSTIYVYDNNSTDGTADIARNAGAVVRYEHLQGKGNVVRRMFQEIDAECYIMVDGDATYPPTCAAQMVEDVLKNGADMVVGDRLSSTYFTENKRPFHNFGNTITRLFINRMFHAQVMDIMTGLRAFSFRFVKTFPVLSKGFEVETEMTIHALYRNMYIKNCVTEYRDRPEGSESKLNTFSDGAKVLKTIFNLYKNYNPFRFFGSMALVLIVLAALFFLPIFREYLVTGLVQRFPTLIVCGFSAIAALTMFITGILLDAHMQKDRQDFEFKLQLFHQLYNKVGAQENL